MFSQLQGAFFTTYIGSRPPQLEIRQHQPVRICIPSYSIPGPWKMVVYILKSPGLWIFAWKVKPRGEPSSSGNNERGRPTLSRLPVLYWAARLDFRSVPPAVGKGSVGTRPVPYVRPSIPKVVRRKRELSLYQPGKETEVGTGIARTKANTAWRGREYGDGADATLGCHGRRGDDTKTRGFISPSPLSLSFLEQEKSTGKWLGDSFGRSD